MEENMNSEDISAAISVVSVEWRVPTGQQNVATQETTEETQEEEKEAKANREKEQKEDLAPWVCHWGSTSTPEGGLEAMRTPQRSNAEQDAVATATPETTDQFRGSEKILHPTYLLTKMTCLTR